MLGAGFQQVPIWLLIQGFAASIFGTPRATRNPMYSGAGVQFDRGSAGQSALPPMTLPLPSRVKTHSATLPPKSKAGSSSSLPWPWKLPTPFEQGCCSLKPLRFFPEMRSILWIRRVSSPVVQRIFTVAILVQVLYFVLIRNPIQAFGME